MTSSTDASSTDAEIDFTKYRRPELAENLSSVLSLPGTLKTILKWSALSLAICWVTIPTLFFDRVHWTLLLAVFCYATLFAIIAGTLLGVVLVVNNKLGSLVQVVDVTFGISEHVSADVAHLRGGTKKMPTARQIIYGVYDSVVLPTLEGVVRGQSKLIGGALFRIYRWSLGRLIARILKDAPHDEAPVDRPSSADSPSLDDSPETETLDTIDGAAETTRRWIAGTRVHLTTAGSTIQRIVVVPMVLLVGGAILFAAVPMMIVWYIT